MLPIIRQKLKEMIVMMIKKKRMKGKKRMKERMKRKKERMRRKKRMKRMKRMKREKEDMGLIDCLLILLPKCQQN